MAILFDDDISGSGQSVFGDSLVLYMLFHSTELGPNVRRLDINDPDHVLRLGWLAFFHRGSDIGGVQRDYYGEPMWIDFENWRWLPPTPRSGAEIAFSVSWGIRWSLSLGCEGHLVVAN